jgi:hypothetical protein
MKKVLLGLLSSVFAFLSCKQPIGDKLKSTIEHEVKAGTNIEHMKIDSFRYSLGNLHEYYESEIDNIRNLIKEKKELLNTSREIHAYSLISILSHELILAKKKAEFLTNMLSRLPDDPKVYTIDYYLDYQTDKSNYQGHKQEFLYAKDFTHVYVDTDSLLDHSAGFKPDNYDSVADINILKLNDSLLVEAKRLDRELQLKIARGTNQMDILQREGIIAKLQLQESSNEIKYIYLYDQ